MVFTLFMIGVAVLFARLLGMSRRVQFMLICVALVFVLLVQVTLPASNSLRLATGGSLLPWVVLIGIGVLIWAYRKGLQALRARHVTPDVQEGPFTTGELDRYARHIVLREIGGLGQRKLKDAKVMVVGAGGLGCPALQYLAAAGVGTIGVIDGDEVSASNLQRQVLFDDAQIGMAKVFAAEAKLTDQNPYVTVKPYRRMFDAETASLVADYDLVLDGTDNFATRSLVNAACVAVNVPLVSGAIGQWEGQLSVFDPAQDAPCYACIFPEEPADGLAPSCAEAGVVGALPGIIGSMMAGEAIKLITGAGEPLRGQMLIFDALYGESRKIAIERRKGCSVCAAP